MSTRYLIAALLMTSACVAQADVLPASGSQSSFLSGWTTADGSNVVNSGTLIGGVAYGNDSADMVKALYDKASASTVGGEVNLSLSQGIEGTYVVGTSNAIMAAMLGNGVSVVNTADGKKVLTGSVASAAQPSANLSTGAGGSQDINTAADLAVGIGTDAGAAAAEVPEPSSIALLMAGMMGAVAFGRRRKR